MTGTLFNSVTRPSSSAILEALTDENAIPLRLAHLAIRVIPKSGEPSGQLVDAQIDSDCIDRAVRRLIG